MSVLKAIRGAGWLKDLNDNITNFSAHGSYTCVTADESGTGATFDVTAGDKIVYWAFDAA